VEAAGGGSRLARLVGVTKGAVQQWKSEGIPAARVPLVSALTGIPMQELRPDLFLGIPQVCQSAEAAQSAAMVAA